MRRHKETPADMGGFGWTFGTIKATENAWEVSRIVNGYMVWFLNKYLKGFNDPMPELKNHPRVIGLKPK